MVGERGVGGAGRVRLDRARQRQALAGEPAAVGTSVDRLAVHRAVQRDPRIERDHRPVRAERETPAGRVDGAPGPGAARPLRPDVASPERGLVGRRVPVVRLHRRDDTQPREPPDVRRVDGLDVFHPVAAPMCPGLHALPVRVAGPGSVGHGRVLERVQRQAHAAIADRVQLHLPAAPVRLGDEGVKPVRLPRREARARVVHVRGEERRGPRLDHAVHEALQDPRVQALATAEAEGLRLVGVQAIAPLGEGLPRLHDQRAAEPQVQLAVGVHPLPERQLPRLQPGVLRGRDAHRVEPGDGGPDGDAILFLGRLRQVAADQVLRRLLERSRGLALRVTDDGPGRRVRRLAVDAGEAQRGGVDPGGVPVVALDEGRSVRDDGVQQCGRGQAARELGVDPAAPEHPPSVRGRGGVGAEAFDDLLRRAGRRELGVRHLARAAQQVDVGVVQAGDDQPARGVDQWLGVGCQPALQRRPVIRRPVFSSTISAIRFRFIGRTQR